MVLLNGIILSSMQLSMGLDEKKLEPESVNYDVLASIYWEHEVWQRAIIVAGRSEDVGTYIRTSKFKDLELYFDSIL